jgi:hypothetical protein
MDVDLASRMHIVLVFPQVDTPVILNALRGCQCAIISEAPDATPSEMVNLMPALRGRRTLSAKGNRQGTTEARLSDRHRFLSRGSSCFPTAAKRSHRALAPYVAEALDRKGPGRPSPGQTSPAAKRRQHRPHPPAPALAGRRNHHRCAHSARCATATPAPGPVHAPAPS